MDQLKSDFVVFPYQLERPVLLETFKNMTRQPWLDEAVERLEYQARQPIDVQLMPGIPGDLSSL